MVTEDNPVDTNLEERPSHKKVLMAMEVTLPSHLERVVTPPMAATAIRAATQEREATPIRAATQDTEATLDTEATPDMEATLEREAMDMDMEMDMVTDTDTDTDMVDTRKLNTPMIMTRETTMKTEETILKIEVTTMKEHPTPMTFQEDYQEVLEPSSLTLMEEPTWEEQLKDLEDIESKT